MFVRSLDPFVTFLCVCLPIVVSNTYCAVFLFCFSSYCVPYVASFSVFLRIVYPMLPVSLDCSFVIAISGLSNVYLPSAIFEHKITEQSH